TFVIMYVEFLLYYVDLRRYVHAMGRLGESRGFLSYFSIWAYVWVVTVRPSFRPLAMNLFGQVIHPLIDEPSSGKMVRPFHRQLQTTWKWFFNRAGPVGYLNVWTILLRDGPSFAFSFGQFCDFESSFLNFIWVPRIMRSILT
ncbi:hypothetical protein HAX54_047159, partial [Datura stramonium]|nr:hypothetical protein [Datura stramonium]